MRTRGHAGRKVTSDFSDFGDRTFEQHGEQNTEKKILPPGQKKWAKNLEMSKIFCILRETNSEKHRMAGTRSTRLPERSTYPPHPPRPKAFSV
jgi:hypothetical protein